MESPDSLNKSSKSGTEIDVSKAAPLRAIYDVVVVGCGPAGGQCARALAGAGHSVLLVERNEDHSLNAFSSAGVPWSLMNQYSLPETLVGSRWDRISVISTRERRSWASNSAGEGCDGESSAHENAVKRMADHPPLGVVLDFAKLRQFLADEASARGADLRMGTEFTSCSEAEPGKLRNVTLTHRRSRQVESLQTRWIVDATGPVRAAIHHGLEEKPEYIKAKGLEWLIELNSTPSVETEFTRRNLIFLLGHHWTKNGYGWVFPMEGRKLKVGSAQYCLDQAADVPLKSYIERLLHELLKLSPGQYRVLDVHGATLRYSRGQKDYFYRNGIFAAGDACSSVNPLGGEGIRHGMRCGQAAADWISRTLNGLPILLSSVGYQAEMRAYFGVKWVASEWLMEYVYRDLTDPQIDRGVRALSRFHSAEEFMGVVFDYRFSSLARTLGRLGWERARKKLGVTVPGPTRDRR